MNTFKTITQKMIMNMIIGMMLEKFKDEEKFIGYLHRENDNDQNSNSRTDD